jgi:methionyl-tRNA formyltransferase
MRSVLIGAVESTLVTYQRLKAHGAPPALLITLAPDLGAKRHSDYVDLAAQIGGETEVLFVENCNAPEHVARAAAVAPDVIFAIGWSQLVGPELSATAKRGVVGFHPALLPKNRGRAAIAWTILQGVEEAGASLFWIDDGVDSGPILAQKRYCVDPRETVPTLLAKCVNALAAGLDEVLPQLIKGHVPGIVQDHTQATYLARRTAEDGLIDWTRPRIEIDRLVRAVTKPYPGAFTFTKKRKVLIWAAEPIDLPHYTWAGAGQVIETRDGCPIVRCGDDKDLLITAYEMDGAQDARLPAGQIKLRPALGMSE